MAWTETPISFSGTGKKGSLLIKPGDIYMGTKADGSDAVLVGHTNQKIEFSITEETKKYKQNGVTVAVAKIGKEAKGAFEFHEYSPDVLAAATGQANILVDSVSGKKRVEIGAGFDADVDVYISMKSETFDGTPVEFMMPCCRMSVSSIPVGSANDSPDFAKIAVEVEAQAATVNGRSYLAAWEWTPLT